MVNTEQKRTRAGLVHCALRQVVAPWQHRLFGTSGLFGCKPTNVEIGITNACCMRCKMCGTWKTPPQDELDIHKWKCILQHLKEWLGVFRLTVSGGEPFLKAGIWELLDNAGHLGLPVIVVTNGFCFDNCQLEHLVSLSLTQIVVSVDSLNPEVHDAIRGRSGAFQRTWATLSYLAKQRRSFLLATNTVIMRDNILELGRIARGLTELGVDRILFQPIQGGFGRDGTDWPYDSGLWPRREQVADGFGALLEARRSGTPVPHTEQELMYFQAYLNQGANWVRPWDCQVGYTSIYCDAQGKVRLCPFSRRNIGSLNERGAQDIWKSRAAIAERDRAQSCRIACMLNCTRQYSLAEQVKYGIALLRNLP